MTREGAGAEEWAEDFLSAVAHRHYIRIKVVVDTKQPGVEGHPIALDYLDAEIRAASAAATEKERERCAKIASRSNDFIARKIRRGDEQDGAPQDEKAP